MIKNIVQTLQELNANKVTFQPLGTMCNILDSLFFLLHLFYA